MASCVPGELIPCAFVWHDPGITPCCKTILSMWARNIDSRSRTATQLPFKSALVPIRLLALMQVPRLITPGLTLGAALSNSTQEPCFNPTPLFG
jgi:hypothetical protein